MTIIDSKKSRDESPLTLRFDRELNGANLYDVSISDGYDSLDFAVERNEIQARTDEYEALLKELKTDSKPEYIEEVVKDAKKYLGFIGNNTIESWASLIPSALALYPLQRPEEALLPNGTAVDPEAREKFRHISDAIGIRTRAKIMAELAWQSAVNNHEKDNLEWVSIACGAAVPVFDAAQTIAEGLDKQVDLKLLDIDPEALCFAEHLAASSGIANTETIEVNILRNDAYDAIPDGTADMVDMLGIFEYFNERTSKRLLSRAYELLKPGGILVLGNMRDTHPQININQLVIEWPKLYPRTPEQVIDIVNGADLGEFSLDVFTPADGVYSVYQITKK